MTAALLLTVALAAKAATVKLFVFDERGHTLDASGLARRISRTDEKTPDLAKLPFWAFSLDGSGSPVRVRIVQTGKLLTASWPGGPATLQLIWPIKDAGFSAVVADNDGHGFSDGAAVFIDEEIAVTEYRLFKDSWKHHIGDYAPPYSPGSNVKQLAEEAQKSLADATRQSDAAKRATGFQSALRATSQAWAASLSEHGLQMSSEPSNIKKFRFGLTLDDGLMSRIEDVEWVAESVARSGANWVRVVLRPNPIDFIYSRQRSFNEVDGIVDTLRKKKMSIMLCILDTAQWPRTMSPAIYAQRINNVVLHFKGKVSSWEVGSELNGDWLGGASAPLTTDQVFQIYSAGVTKARELDPRAEIVATLYGWEATAPDRAHSLSGWLKHYSPLGFAKSADIVGLSLYPEDNPVGVSLERVFDQVADILPGTPLILSSYGYVEKDALKGYWWLAPDDVEGARKNLVASYTFASCALRSSLCGGFWWQTLDQMLPPGRHKTTDLYKTFSRTMSQKDH